MKVERLVIDSNVWIAALISPECVARQLVNAVLDRNIDIFMSEATFTELVSRLERPRFDRYRDPESWNLFLSELVDLALWLEDSGIAIGICRDADDEKFLALAQWRQGSTQVGQSRGDSDSDVSPISPAIRLVRTSEPSLGIAALS